MRGWVGERWGGVVNGGLKYLVKWLGEAMR